jgi:hypothetical protein
MWVFVNRFIVKAKEAGFIVQYYGSHTTNSHYIKLDYGVAHSVRVSDHNGKRHLKYMYNVMTTQGKKESKLEDQYVRYFFPVSEESIDEIISMACDVRNYTFGYEELVEKAKSDAKDKKGFWQYADLM